MSWAARGWGGSGGKRGPKYGRAKAPSPTSADTHFEFAPVRGVAGRVTFSDLAGCEVVRCLAESGVYVGLNHQPKPEPAPRLGTAHCSGICTVELR